MGKISILTPEQKIILSRVSQSQYLRSRFYFTGGTALSTYYLQHRYSEDLDFFSEKSFDTQEVFSLVGQWAKSNDFTFTTRSVETVHMVMLQFRNGVSLKADFVHYPFPRIEQGTTRDGVIVDSLLDIAVNKIVALSQRDDVKDFVDFYYLEQKFGVWDLFEGAKVKFRLEFDPVLFASDMLKIEDFDFLPKMIKPLSLPKLKAFFRARAREIGKRVVVG